MYTTKAAEEELLTIIAKSKNKKDAAFKIAEWLDSYPECPLITLALKKYSTLKKKNAWRDSPLMRALE